MTLETTHRSRADGKAAAAIPHVPLQIVVLLTAAALAAEDAAEESAAPSSAALRYDLYTSTVVDHLLHVGSDCRTHCRVDHGLVLLGGLVFGGHGNEVKDARNTRPPGASCRNSYGIVRCEGNIAQHCSNAMPY